MAFTAASSTGKCGLSAAFAPTFKLSSSLSCSSSSMTAPSISSQDIKRLLAHFDTQINKMMDYPAKDIINSLTMSAEKFEYAHAIVQFLETKIHRVPPNFKLPIFYLMDSILKNVKGPYAELFGLHIVPLYCNCVRQVLPKDLRRFVHVLNTWESSQLFAPSALGQMRAAATHAMAQVEPSKIARLPVSFANERKPTDNDLQLRGMLTQLQNDMNIHPTQHMSLEEVSMKNPQYYQQLLDFAKQSKSHTINAEPLPNNPIRNSHSKNSNDATSLQVSRSANVAHLMKLLKSKRRSLSPPARNHINQAKVKGPNPAAVMSILQKLKGFGSERTNTSKMWFSDKIVLCKERVEANIQKLYAARPLICRESGVRFCDQTKLDAHLDFLFQYNRSLKDRNRGGNSRAWYSSVALWIEDFSMEYAMREKTSSSVFDQGKKEETEEYAMARVAVDETVSKCRICGEPFEKSWVEEEEEWMYLNAIIGTIWKREAETESTIFHKYCYDTVLSHSKKLTLRHLIPETPQTGEKREDLSPELTEAALRKRQLEESEEEESDEDRKRVRS